MSSIVKELVAYCNSNRNNCENCLFYNPKLSPKGDCNKGCFGNPVSSATLRLSYQKLVDNKKVGKQNEQ